MLIEATPRDAETLAALLPEGEDAFLAARLTQTVGYEMPGPEGVSITYQGAVQYRSVDVPPDLSFLVRLAEGVSIAIVAGWLRERFRGRTSKLIMNRRSIDLDDEGQVRRIIEEEIRQREGHDDG